MRAEHYMWCACGFAIAAGIAGVNNLAPLVASFVACGIASVFTAICKSHAL